MYDAPRVEEAQGAANLGNVAAHLLLGHCAPSNVKPEITARHQVHDKEEMAVVLKSGAVYVPYLQAR